MTRVAVIGAGLAGLHAARRLHDAGAEVRVFDKARGSGGRMSTRRTDFGAFDHGAQYFTARDPRFRAQVEKWVASGAAAPWPGKVVRLAEGRVVAEEQAEPRFVGAPKMNAVVRDLLGEIDASFGVRIETLRRREEGWVLRCDADFEYEGFDLVVVAVPPAQALPLIDASSKLGPAIAGVRMWPCHATMLSFEAPLPVAFDGAFVESESIAWVARNDSKAERGKESCWVVHTHAEWSERHVEREPASVGEHLEEEFARVLGVELPPVRYRGTHRWLYARPAHPLDGSTLFDPEVGLGICGDWTRGDKVEDAFVSAEDLVDVILPAYGLG